MRFSRLILTACVLALGAATSQAGPLRNLAQRVFHPPPHGGCSSCGGGCGGQQVAPQAPQAPQVMPTSGQVVYQTSYAPPVVAGYAPGAQYQPIRLGVMLPTCVGGSCPR